MKKFVIIFFLSTIILNAQVFEVGLRLQTSAYKLVKINKSESYFKHPVVPLPSEFFLNISIYPFNNFGIDLRAGRVFLDYEITGMEYAILGKYYISSIYFIAGYIIHANEGGGGNSSGWRTVSIGMPGVGIGYKPSDLISFDLIFLDPKDEVIEHYRTSQPPPEWNANKLSWMIKFNIGFNWQL